MHFYRAELINKDKQIVTPVKNQRKSGKRSRGKSGGTIKAKALIKRLGL